MLYPSVVQVDPKKTEEVIPNRIQVSCIKEKKSSYDCWQGQKPVTSGSTVLHLGCCKPGWWRLPHFCFVVLGMGKGKKKLLTLLVETSSQGKKKKKESTPKYSKYYLNVVNPTSIARRKQKLEPRNTCLKFFIHKMGCSALVQTLLCPKHPETIWKGFIFAFRKKPQNPEIKERISP